MIDVCLLLEGTYPYLTGGVSSCVHQIILNTPHLNYGIIHIGVDRKSSTEYKYKLPDNVKFVEDIYLFEYEKPKKSNYSPSEEEVKELFDLFFHGETELFDSVSRNIFNKELNHYDPSVIFSSESAWSELIERYRDNFLPIDEPSFVDYFYNWRFSLFPVIKILKTKIPKAKVYHSLCTGYAGLLGCMAKNIHKRPFILSEHGIYVHERIIEISQANWLNQEEDEEFFNLEHRSFFKDWWIRLFTNMGQLAYDYADDITSLYGGNIKKQISFGADQDKISLIANGINIDTYTLQKEEKEKDSPVHIALVGRVVPIKDIKTFIKSISFVYSMNQNIEVSIIGPYDEDKVYYDECERLVKILGLEDIIKFTGKRNVLDEYPGIDLMVLSSISEGQPIVILEAMACGIPFVSTDVGSCGELLLGQSKEDKDLGICGYLVPFGNVNKMGNAILELVNHPEVRFKMGEVARERVNKYYNEKDVIKKYNKLYRKNMAELY